MGKKGKDQGKGGSEHKSKRKEDRAFDFSKCNTRQIALQISYVGWDYKGFAAQDDTEDTIEGHLFAALKKTCLIQGVDYRAVKPVGILAAHEPTKA